MTIYLANIGLLIVWNLILQPKKENNVSGKRLFCILASFQWFILSAFRHFDIGSDTWFYGYLFDDVASKSWSQIFNESYNILTGAIEGRDVGYVIFSKAVSCIYNDYRFLLIIVAALLAITLGKFIYQHSHDVLFSYILFSCLFYSFFAITGLRQTIATCILVFGSYNLIKEKKIVKFLILSLLLSTIHKSCLIYILMYFIANKKITKTYLTITTLVAAFCFAVKIEFFTFLADSSGYGSLYNVVDGAGAWTFTALLFAIFGFVLFYSERIISKNLHSTHWVNALCLACIFVPLTFVEPNTMRIVQYFSVFLMLLIPLMVECVEKKQRTLITISIEVVLIALLVISKPVYYFM